MKVYWREFKKTVDSKVEFDTFKSCLRSMSMQVTTAATELAAITKSEEQLEIKNKNLFFLQKPYITTGMAKNMSLNGTETDIACLTNIN